ncbi:MAG: hypothetical protein Q6M04_09320, partial [Thermostichus sp. BF3_bins_97]
MTFSGDQDPTRASDRSGAEGAARSSASARGEVPSSQEGRRSPPPLPEEGSVRSAGSERASRADDLLDSGRASGTESYSPRSARSSRDLGESGSGPAREASMGGSPRSTERSSPSRSGQALVPRRPAPRGYEGSSRSAYASPYRGESSYRSDYSRSSASSYTSSYVGGGGSGMGGGSGSARGGLSPSSLTVVALVALLAFFGGFAIRNIFAESGGFDDERPIRAANVPEAFREFCFAYNGTASFTVVELTTVSALTMASVPIYRMDTCTIPVSQTANALQALGIRGRAGTLGPQLGGSNLTLIQIPLASGLARAVFNQFPALANQGNEAQVLSQLETTINNALRSNVEGLALQSLEPTNIPDVYV